jgi:hypothetical protein
MPDPIHPLPDVTTAGLAALIRPVVSQHPEVRIMCRARFFSGEELPPGPLLLVCWGDALDLLARWPGRPGFGLYDLSSPLPCLHEGLLALTRGATTWFCPVSRPLAASLRSMPERQRQIFTLYASGLRMKTICTRLGLKPQTVSEHLRRARLHFLACGVLAPLSVARILPPPAPRNP